MYHVLQILFCITAVSLAAEHRPYVGYQHPETYDYNKDSYIINRALPNHIPQRFTFKFEQVRRDQPPQVELRDEEIGKYLYRPKPTTTTEIPSAFLPKLREFSDLPDEFNQVEAHRRFPSINTHLNQQWTTIPSTPVPQWEPLAQTEEIIPEVYLNPIPTTTLAPVTFVPSNNKFNDLPLQFNRIDAARRYPPVNTHLTPKPTTPAWNIIADEINTSQRLDDVDLSAYVPATQVKRTRVNKIPRIVTSTDSIQLPHMQHRPQRNRGHHKFSSSDLVKVPTETQTSVSYTTSTEPQTVPKRRSPPPVPTLSPWIDGFGK